MKRITAENRNIEKRRASWRAYKRRHRDVDGYGLIVDFSDGIVAHFPGKDALAQAIAYADARGTKVCVISSPESIERDLQGARKRQTPEYRGLLRAGRLDLLAGGDD